jgi:hypothetical protein
VGSAIFGYGKQILDETGKKLSTGCVISYNWLVTENGKHVEGGGRREGGGRGSPQGPSEPVRKGGGVRREREDLEWGLLKLVGVDFEFFKNFGASN